jgi:2,3,4,5-tetrahydropyridine-2-carboxylate N-succinyltransferase
MGVSSIIGPSEEVLEIIEALDSGRMRVCNSVDGKWVVNERVKEAILSCFELAHNQKMGAAHDRIPLKFEGWEKSQFDERNIRVIPGCVVRKGAFIANDVVLMNCFVNVGTYIDEKTLIDSFVTVGACAQIGKSCHIAASVVIGGVLEPANASPVIIEDSCFIGANSSIVEGVIVRKGAVIAMNTHIGASTKIIDRETGKFFNKEIPESAVVVPGTYQSKNNLSINCAVIVRYGKAKTNVGINERLRRKDPAKSDGKNGI